jgi:hypothetical protein
MAHKFEKLKKNLSLEKLTKELEKLDKGSFSSSDDRFWQPETDKAGNGYAVIRFLDAPEVDGDSALPWVQVFNHGFKSDDGKWFIENCPTTIGEQCPVCENNSVLWNTGIENNKDIVRKRKRRLTYISNILVLKDPANPSNEGNVYLYKYGKKIFDKIKEMIEPQFEDESAINPFNFWEGANFKLKIRQVEGYRNYDKSEFESSVSAVYDNDEDIKALWEKLPSLAEFAQKSQFKPYDELKTKLDRVLGVNGTSSSYRASAEEELEDEEVVTESNSNNEESNDTMEYFRKLAQG